MLRHKRRRLHESFQNISRCGESQFRCLLFLVWFESAQCRREALPTYRMMNYISSKQALRGLQAEVILEGIVTDITSE
jgi:hypothetical protein